jgi:hypothetical protein
MYFNEYVMGRWEKGQQQLQGDIMIDRYYASGARVGMYQDQEVRLFDYKKLKEKYVGEGFFDPPLLINHGKGKTFPYSFSAEETTWVST